MRGRRGARGPQAGLALPAAGPLNYSWCKLTQHDIGRFRVSVAPREKTGSKATPRGNLASASEPARLCLQETLI